MSVDVATLIRPEIKTIDGLAIRVAKGDWDPKLRAEALLLSPWPESLYAYEPTWARLAEHANLIAVDLPGFGHSERRESLMSPSAMGDFIVKIADALGLERPHVVGPDVGTAASLFAAARHPGRFRTLSIGTGGAAVPLELGEPLKGWVQDPDVEGYRSIDGREVVKVALGTLESYTPSETAREDYLSAYAGERFYESLAYVRKYPQELPVLRDLLSKIEIPVNVVSGAKDTVVPRVNAEFLVERLPNANLALIDAGHFIWEDGANDYAAEIISWWERH
ncbi:pimeloyl-ACP methyl ester carboxylesterase [Sphingomonas leidyi]|uniref:Pimeloyl-ACP methyl ester carboxylesterase n=1 Tax=Sphingomonas leidyi TaxID=68569 RepID=A0A7X5UZ07_9SPHN|nr:alpha/beta hydrolase [Sphingomonas leidyi]NIJ64217.1 pimeloyl-ACP methyl ester carboxylesterase [Sphingomonas leidyi]